MTIAARRRAPPRPGEIRVRGFDAAKEAVQVGDLQVGQYLIRFQSDAEVPAWVAERFRLFLAAPRYTILHTMDARRPADLSFVDDLAARGYDLSTLKIRVFLASHAPRPPAAWPYVAKSRQGWLKMRFGRIPHEGLDLVACYHPPAVRRDSNLLIGIFSEGTSSTNTSSWRRRQGMRDFFRASGLDEQTFRFAVHCPQRPIG